MQFLLPLVFSFVLSILLTDAAPLTSEESNILIALVNHLRNKISHIIIVKNTDSIFERLKNFKMFVFLHKYVGFKTEDELFNYITDYKPKYGSSKTLIAYKEQNLEFFKNFACGLNDKSQSHFLSVFTWLIFLDETSSSPVYHPDFYIPYDCNFFLVSLLNTSGYKITKTYNLDSNRIYEDYGAWDYINGPSLPETSKHLSKIDMNQTRLLTCTYICTKDRELEIAKSTSPSVCLRQEFFRDIMKSINFRYIETTDLNLYGDLDALADPVEVHDGNYVFPLFKYVKYWPKCRFALVIKYPESDNTADYYVRPFNSKLWFVTISAVIGGGLFCVFMKFIRSLIVDRQTHSTVNKNKGRNVPCLEFPCLEFHAKLLEPQNSFTISAAAAYFLLPFNALCNQGDECEESLSSRICFFVFRALAIFIVPAFGAELTAYLAIKILHLPFTSLEEFVENGNYKLLIQKNQFTELYFTSRNDTVGRQIREAGLIEIVTLEDQLPKLCSKEKYVLPYTTDVYFPKIGCRVFLIPEQISYLFSITYLSEDNPYHRIINLMFARAREAGFIQRIYGKILSSLTEQTLPESEEDFQSIGINQLIHTFCFVGFGIFIAFIIHIFEIILSRCWRGLQSERRKKKIKVKNTMGMLGLDQQEMHRDRLKAERFVIIRGSFNNCHRLIIGRQTEYRIRI